MRKRLSVSKLRELRLKASRRLDKQIHYTPESGISDYCSIWSEQDDKGLQARITEAKSKINTWSV